MLIGHTKIVDWKYQNFFAQKNVSVPVLDMSKHPTGPTF